MEKEAVFNYMDLLKVQLTSEIDAADIENYFPQTISQIGIESNSDYIISYNVSQYETLKKTLPSFEDQNRKFPFRSAPAISKQIDILMIILLQIAKIKFILLLISMIQILLFVF